MVNDEAVDVRETHTYEYRYPTTISVKSDGSGEEITISNAKTPEEVAYLLRKTRRLIAEQTTRSNE